MVLAEHHVGCLRHASLAAQRAVTLVAVCVVLLGCGVMYAFSSYSGDIKAHMNYTQTELEHVGLFVHVGTYVAGPVCGFAVDRTGPFLGMIVALVLWMLGHALAYLSLSFVIDAPNLAMAAFYLVVGIGNTFAISSAVTTTAKAFPHEHRGKAMGVAVMAMAVGGAVFSWVHRAFPGPALIESFELCVTGVLAGVAVIALIFLRLPANVTWRVADDTAPGSVGKAMGDEAAFVGSTDDVEQFDSRPASFTSRAPATCCSVLAHALSIFCQPWFYALFVVFMIGTGTGLLIINNAGELETSVGVGVEHIWIATTISACNAIARIAFGVISDPIARMMPRIGFLALPLLFLCGAAAMMVAAPQNIIVIAAIGGVGYGGVFGIGVPVLSEWFPLDGFGHNNGWLLVGTGIGSLTLNEVAGVLYDQQVEPGATVCRGDDCYRTIATVASALCGVAAALCILFAILRARRDKRLLLEQRSLAYRTTALSPIDSATDTDDVADAAAPAGRRRADFADDDDDDDDDDGFVPRSRRSGAASAASSHSAATGSVRHR